MNEVVTVYQGCRVASALRLRTEGGGAAQSSVLASLQKLGSSPRIPHLSPAPPFSGSQLSLSQSLKEKGPHRYNRKQVQGNPLMSMEHLDGMGVQLQTNY